METATSSPTREMPTQEFYQTKSSLIGCIVACALLLLGSAWTVSNYFRGEYVSVKGLVGSFLCIPFCLFGLWYYFQLLRNPRPQLTVSSLGITPPHVKNNQVIAWGHIEDIRLIDASRTWLIKRWVIQIILKDAYMAQYKSGAFNRWLSGADLVIPVTGLTQPPHAILSILREYLEEGHRRANF